MTTEEILRCHARRYPLMEPTDAVKLLYQSEFGGGHLITDPMQSLLRLQAEFRSVQKQAGAALTEDIGGGLVRVQLAALDEQTLPLERLNELFVRSAAEVHGTLSSFWDKITLLSILTQEDCFAFDTTLLKTYLAAYEAAGCPPVSHSPAYRRAYTPAYRVLLAERLKTALRE